VPTYAADADGTPVPQQGAPDQGAYEYAVGPPEPPVPPPVGSLTPPRVPTAVVVRP
jgi:hypothetical protein